MVRRTEVEAGQRPGVTSEQAEQIAKLKRENAELRRANEILKSRGALEDLVLHLQHPGAAAQLNQLATLVAGDPVLAPGIDLVDGHPTAQTRLADPEILRDLRDRLVTTMGQLNSTAPELRRLGSRH